MRRNGLVGGLVCSLWFAVGVAAQNAPDGGRGQRAQINVASDPLLRGFRWRSIGPAGQGGRVDDIAVSEQDPRIIYVGFATGGLWKSVNNGTTFQPVFDTYPVSSVGNVALAPSNHDIVYVGTGEANNRQSSSFGAGMYKSTDGGKTFAELGLRETQSIARIVVHPTNPDIVWVAASGQLFGANPERGVFKSSDGGRTFRKVLFVDNNTGATDLVIDRSNPDVLFAATYQRRRASWGFASGGPGSGIWRSDNGGENWTRLSGNGLPSGTMGRVALDIARSNSRVIYAQIEVAPDKVPVTLAKASDAGQNAGAGGRGQGGGGGGRGGDNQPPDPEFTGTWKSTDGGRTWQFLNNHNPRPMYFSQIRVDPTNENIVYTAGLPVFKSIDGGKTFRELAGFGHVDQHAIWLNPKNGEHVMIGNDGSVDVSYDGGEAWESLRSWSMGQAYHVSADMRRPYTVCTGLQDNGSWCGPSSLRGGGAILTQDWWRSGGGDGFYSQMDPSNANIVYSESQNGNMNRIDLSTGEQVSIRPRAAGGGRGQGGGGEETPGGAAAQQASSSNIVPAPAAGAQFRWNWNTPLLISPHNPNIIYTGANYFFKSLDRGDTWTMSADLSKQINRDNLEIMGLKGTLPSCNRNTRGQQCILSKGDGTNSYGNIISLAESPLLPGVLWVGTDDGNVQLSRDGGTTWTEVGKTIPGGTRDYYVSRVEASWFDPATAFVSLDGHRHNDLKPYVFVTRDYGKTWQSITAGLPEFGNVNTIRQDPKNRNLLYAGTEFGFFVSTDEGRSWKKFMTDLATVRIDDVLVHPRDGDLILATHGRSIMIMDDITPLQQLTAQVLNADAHLFQPRDAVAWKTDRRLGRSVTGDKNFRGESAPAGTTISYYLRGPSSDVKLTITDLRTGEVFRALTPSREGGMNRVLWNLRGNGPPQGGRAGGGGGAGGGQGPMAQPGSYRVTLTVAGKETSRIVNVLEDRWLNER